MARQNLTANARRALTVEAVIALAATTNPAALTTAQIAAHMGVTQGALFRHFADKAQIWTAVVEWTASELLGRFDRVSGTTPTERLRGMFDAHIDCIMTYPGVPRIVFAELQRAGDTAGKAQVMTLMRDYRARVMAVLDQAANQSLINPSTDTAAAATQFLGMIQGLVMQAMAADDFASMPAMAHRLFPLFLAGLGA